MIGIEKRLERIEKTVVFIYNKNPILENGIPISAPDGHGVFIAPGLILTVSHVFYLDEESKKGSVFYAYSIKGKSAGLLLQAKLLDFKVEVDFALLIIMEDGLDYNWAPFATSVFTPQRVHLVASTDSKTFQYKGGGCISNHHFLNTTNNYLAKLAPGTPLIEASNIHSLPGFSGSPLFNSKGEILGILSYHEFSCLADYFIPYYVIEKLCARALGLIWKNKESTRKQDDSKKTPNPDAETSSSSKKSKTSETKKKNQQHYSKSHEKHGKSMQKGSSAGISKLDHSDGREAAIELMDHAGKQGEEEFKMEVELLSHLRSPYLRGSIGYCSDSNPRLLVSEFMPNGGLQEQLYSAGGISKLDWETRLGIALDAAKGLEYLHEHVIPPVIHRDFKTSNILQDKNFHANVSDCGLAKLGPEKAGAHVSTRVLGTQGYVAPEYALTGHLTTNSSLQISCEKGLQVFTFKQLHSATGGFSKSNVIGQGSFGSVYRGFLNDGRKAAIKLMDHAGKQGEEEFKMEVELLSHLRSPYLLGLIGYCSDSNHRLLVYEFMPNGGLHLYSARGSSAGISKLDWETRLGIALDAAKGLEYLHEHVSPPVIHRDFKTSNILLDKNFHAKVSDFGLAKLGPEKAGAHVSTRVLGTQGYVAPEYTLTGHLTTKSDVYSYGVVLLELLTGRIAVDMKRPQGEGVLVSWALPHLTDRERVLSIMDPAMEGQYTLEEVIQVATIAAMCVQPEADYRPLMADVVQSLVPLVKLHRSSSRHSGSSSFHAPSLM